MKIKDLITILKDCEDCGCEDFDVEIVTSEYPYKWYTIGYVVDVINSDKKIIFTGKDRRITNDN